jgi:hypothetical protein
MGKDAGLAALLLMRHAAGDGGDIDSHDAGLNAEAIKLGGARVLSVYKLLGAGRNCLDYYRSRQVSDDSSHAKGLLIMGAYQTAIEAVLTLVAFLWLGAVIALAFI